LLDIINSVIVVLRSTAKGTYRRVAYQRTMLTSADRLEDALRAEAPGANEADKLIAFLVTALDNIQRADNLDYAHGAADAAIHVANVRRVRNTDGYLVVRHHYDSCGCPVTTGLLICPTHGTQRAAEVPVLATAPDFVRAFLEKLHTFDWLEAPQACIEQDGDVGFDWSTSPQAMVSAHISATGRAGWAALIGDYKSRGTFQWPDWPDELTTALEKVMQAAPVLAPSPAVRDLLLRAENMEEHCSSLIQELASALRQAAPVLAVPPPPMMADEKIARFMEEARALADGLGFVKEQCELRQLARRLVRKGWSPEAAAPASLPPPIEKEKET
jgi:hypothetical protein